MPFPLLSIALFAVAGVLTYLFIFGFVWGAGYYPSPKKEILEAGDLLEIKAGSTIYDLGCGFGKVVFTLARRYPDTKFVGVDIDPLKISWCKLVVRLEGLSNQVRIVRRNMLQVNLSEGSGVYVFLTEETKIMEYLKEKMFREMKPGTRVVSYVHKFHSWEPSVQKGSLRLYVIPSPEPDS